MSETRPWPAQDAWEYTNRILNGDNSKMNKQELMFEAWSRGFMYQVMIDSIPVFKYTGETPTPDDYEVACEQYNADMVAHFGLYDTEMGIGGEDGPDPVEAMFDLGDD